MPYRMKPLSCDPAKIKGMSERLIVSHYENNYGGAVKRLNLIDEKLALYQRAAPEHWLLFFTHDPQVALAQLGRDDKGRFVTLHEQGELKARALG